jgi:preprotein translocase subunit SecG
MLTALIVLQYVICVLLTIVVLMQYGKGAEAGAMMGSGGSSQNIFTSSTKGNVFSKLTAVLAVSFMVNSLAITVLKSGQTNKSVFDDEPISAPLNSDAIPTKEGAEAEAKPADTQGSNKENKGTEGNESAPAN